jgi:hypothetical protein
MVGHARQIRRFELRLQAGVGVGGGRVKLGRRASVLLDFGRKDGVPARFMLFQVTINVLLGLAAKRS